MLGTPDCSELKGNISQVLLIFDVAHNEHVCGRVISIVRRVCVLEHTDPHSACYQDHAKVMLIGRLMCTLCISGCILHTATAQQQPGAPRSRETLRV